MTLRYGFRIHGGRGSKTSQAFYRMAIVTVVMSVAKAAPQKSETPRLEDYLEAIYSLFEEKGYASTVDISDRLQVRPPTVTSMVQKLAKKGYLIHEPYRGMRLT